MEVPTTVSYSGSMRGGPAADSSRATTLSGGGARRVNFTQKLAHPKNVGATPPRSSLQRTDSTPSLNHQASQALSTAASEKSRASRASISSKALTPAQQPVERTASTPLAENKAGGAFSFSRVQAAGGAQGSLGSETDYWFHAAPTTTSAAHRAFSLSSKYEAQSETSEALREEGRFTSGRMSNIERILGTTPVSADKKGETSHGLEALRQAVDALHEDRELEGQEQQQDLSEWQEPLEEKDSDGAISNGSAIATELWKRRDTQSSTYSPLCSRTLRERCAYTTSDDWAIFALHNQYVRPLRDREWVPGEPCIIRRNCFELPPGACRFSEVSCGIPATAFDSFVFPNPPRQFLISSSKRTSGNVEFAQPSSVRSGRGRGGARGSGSQLTQEQLLDLERMLWFDPEPRLERPFRLYADSKTCLKGRIHDIGHIMRSGW
ncbi:hypothetical protein, conserved [Eimeria necatrix]|uniref:Uncharacterized protein n=1 Tax=Eimeria necatrix TaxID=51315 RepID=U6N2Y3_9EIME|nr:hypothetical protein, conserved [Eimeria necatrix]CDJ68310.1 hypothetical protein, conserved [Eimeria necatrix]